MPSSAAELFLSGVDQLERYPEGAIRSFSEAIQKDSRFAPAYNYRGVAKAMIDDDTAIGDFTEAVLLYEDYADAYFNRGYYKHTKKNDIKSALDDYNLAISNISSYAYGNYYHFSRTCDPYIQRAEALVLVNRISAAISVTLLQYCYCQRIGVFLRGGVKPTQVFVNSRRRL